MAAEGSRIAVLCVDDEPGMADLVSTYLERVQDRLSVTTAQGAEEALTMLAEQDIDCIVSDYEMPRMDGLAFLESVRADHPDLPFVLFTDRGSEDIASEAISAGVTDYMRKGTTAEQYRILAHRVCNAVERYRACDEDRDAQERAETILETSPDAILVSVDEQLVYANPAAGDLFGTGIEDLTGRSFAEFVTGDDGTGFGTLAADDGAVERYRHTLSIAEGETVPVEVTAREITWESESGVVAVVRDISTRQGRGEVPSYRRPILESVFESARDGVLVTTADWEVIDYNDRFTELWGLPDDVPATGDARQVLEIVRERVEDEAAFVEAVETQYGDPSERQRTQIELTDGSVLDQYSEPITDDDGNHFGYVWFYRDVTDFERAGTELKQTVEELRHLYRITSDPDLSFERKREQILDRGTEFFDLPYGFISKITESTQHIVDAVGSHELLRPGESCPIEQSYCRKTVGSDEGFIAIHDAIEAGWEETPSYQTFKLGSYIGAKIVVDDELYGTLCFASSEPRGCEFSERERTIVEVMARWIAYELEQKRYNDQLEAQNDRLEEFASIVSHDLRNPLNVAKGRLRLVEDECDSEHIPDVAKAHDRMETLIEDILLMARADRTVDELTRVRLASVVDACWDTVGTKGATVDIQTDSTVMADETRLRQLLENLVRNAVEHGGADVTVTVGDLDDGFYVADDGDGIPDDISDRIFERGFSSSHDGTGFGLSIAEQIGAAHGWEITATESETGGARFEITGVNTVD